MVANHPETFDRFTWTVPKAFADALDACHFSKGDTLYSFRHPYTKWDDAFLTKNTGKKYLIVTSPEQKPTPGSVDMFEVNWNTPAEVEIHTIGEVQTEKVKTTQGRIYTLLHKNDWTSLSLDTPPPPIPRTSSYLKLLLSTPLKTDVGTSKTLEEQLELNTRRNAFQRNLLSLVTNKVPTAQCFFALPYDPCNELLRTKWSRLETSFRNTSEVRSINLTEEDCLLLKIDDVLPTLELRVLVFMLSSETVLNRLKEILYSPTVTNIGKESRFRIGAHGMFSDISL